MTKQLEPAAAEAPALTPEILPYELAEQTPAEYVRFRNFDFDKVIRQLEALGGFRYSGAPDWQEIRFGTTFDRWRFAVFVTRGRCVDIALEPGLTLLLNEARVLRVLRYLALLD